MKLFKKFAKVLSSAVKYLDVEIPSEYLEESLVSDDPVDKIIHKYSNHPSIKLITDNVITGKFSFSEVTLSLMLRNWLLRLIARKHLYSIAFQRKW